MAFKEPNWHRLDCERLRAAEDLYASGLSEYRRLEHGEIIEEGDEVDRCADPWRDEPVWEPAGNIGEPAPDPQYPSHRQYRRRIG